MDSAGVVAKIPEKLVLSVSDIKQFMTCPQLFHYKFYDKLGPAYEQGVARVVGTAVHSFLEQKLRGEPVLPLPDYWPEEFDRLPEEQKEEAIKQFATLYPALQVWAPRTQWEIVDVEREFRRSLGEIDGCEVELVGRADCIVRTMGKLWHLQHKTIHASRPTDVYAEVMRTDLHESAYEWMAGAVYNEPFGGTILNCIRKLSKKRIDEDPTCAFATYFLTRSEQIVEDAIDTIRQQANAILWSRTAEQIGLSPVKNRSACGGIFGNSLCPYKDVCDYRRPLSAMGFVEIEQRYAADDAGADQ